MPARPRQIGRTTARDLLLGFGFSVVAIAVLFGVVSVFTHGAEHGMLSIAGVTALLPLLAVVWYRRDYRVAEPLTIVIVAVVLGVTLKPAFVLYWDHENPAYFYLSEPNALFMITPALIIAWGMVALSVGYLLAPSYAMRSPGWFVKASSLDGTKVRIVAAVSAILSVVGLVLYVREFGLEAITSDISRKRFVSIEGSEYRGAVGYFRWMASLTKPALLVGLAWALSSYKRVPLGAGIWLTCLGIATVAFSFVNSDRTGILLVLLQVAILWACVRGAIPKRVATVAGLAVLGLLLLATALRPGRVTQENLEWSEALGINTFVEVTFGQRQFLDLPRTAHIIENVPQAMGYKYGSTFVAWVFAPVPRGVWPEKPPLGPGPEIGDKIFGVHPAGVPPGLIGEGYLNFGFFGVLLVPFIYGYAAGWVFGWFRPVLRYPAGAVLYSSVIVFVGWTWFTVDFSRMIVSGILNALPILLMLAFARRRLVRRRARRPAASVPA